MTKTMARRSKRRRGVRRRAGTERPRLQPRAPVVRAQPAAVPTPRAGETIELETAFSDASLEMDETSEKFRVGSALQDSVASTDAALAAHVGAGGDAHAIAVPGTAGFLSVADKAKLDAVVLGGGVASELWAPPATPHALDDEFTGTTLAPAWLKYMGWVDQFGALFMPSAPAAFDFGTPIDLDTTPADDTARCSLSRRTSWLQAQPGGKAIGAGITNRTLELYLLKPMPAVTNLAIWARAAVAGLYDGVVNASVVFYGDSGGAPNPYHYLHCTIATNGTTPKITGSYRIPPAGGFGVLDLDATDFGTAHPIDLIGIQKTGTTYRLWWGNSYGGSVNSPSAARGLSLAGTFAYVGIKFHGHINADARVMYSFDFFRVQESKALPL